MSSANKDNWKICILTKVLLKYRSYLDESVESTLLIQDCSDSKFLIQWVCVHKKVFVNFWKGHIRVSKWKEEVINFNSLPFEVFFIEKHHLYSIILRRRYQKLIFKIFKELWCPPLSLEQILPSFLHFCCCFFYNLFFSQFIIRSFKIEKRKIPRTN